LKGPTAYNLMRE